VIRVAVIEDIAEIHRIPWELEHENVTVARRLRADLEDDMLLLDDLGWKQDDPREGFELTMDPDALRATLTRVREVDPDDEETYTPRVHAVGYTLALVRDDHEPTDEEQEPDGLVTVTIGRERRHVLYDQVVADLSAAGDLHIELRAGDERAEAARLLRRQFFGDMRLLDEIGWGDEDPGESFAVTMERTVLVDTLARLNSIAAYGVRSHVENVADEQEEAQECAVACDAIGAMLADVARQ
jgi:hypothetical protein